MFSEKMTELGEHRSVIREIFEYSKKRKAEIGAENVFDFSLGNPSVPTPESFRKTLLNLITNTESVNLHGYTSAQGDSETRNAISDNIKIQFGFSQPSDLIYMTCGAASSLTITFKAMLDIGDEVIIPAPYFPEYRVFVENAGGIVVPSICKKDDFQLDISGIERKINEKTRAIIINSPNNPTGVIFLKESLQNLAALLLKKSNEYGKPIFIIADEPYRALVYDDNEVIYIPTVYDNTVVCTSYSKSLSIPGERIGYIAVSPKTFKKDRLYSAICGAGRSMGYVCAPSLFQKAITCCETLQCDTDLYDKNRKTLYNALSQIGYECLLPQGAFYLFVKALENDAKAFAERAKDFELLIVPSDSFGVEGWIRIAYCTDYLQIEKSLPAFKKLYEAYGR